MPAQTAFVRVRLLPWRVRARVMDPDTLRDSADPLTLADDLSGVVIGIGLWLVVVVAAPVLVVVLAGLLLPFEVVTLALIALLVAVARVAGLVPWTIAVVDAGGRERTEQSRNLVYVVRRVRALNGGGRVKVRWSWS